MSVGTSVGTYSVHAGNGSEPVGELPGMAVSLAAKTTSSDPPREERSGDGPVLEKLELRCPPS